MATYQALQSYYSNTLRVNISQIPAADAAKLTALSARVDANTLSFAAAAAEVAKLGINTTSVATLSYQFFTGAIPRDQGIDYLVSPGGGNVNNLNSAYYQNFNIENRYINFAVNLGKLGEGAAKFQADYGQLSLTQALVKAYTQIFGTAPAADKVVSLLADMVPNGAGGTYTRGEYFAFYGRDGVDGIGTKAAMVGWLLAQAAKEDIGVYAKANDALLLDIAADKLAAYQTDLLASYGVPAATGPGVTITVAHDQTVTVATAIVRASVNDDIVTAPNGLDAGQWISTGAGRDTVTITGAPLSGYVDTGSGNDVINVDVLNPSVAIIGGVLTGHILAGAGDDVITVGRLRNGAVIDGGAGDDRATIGIKEELISQTEPPVIRNVEHLTISDFQLQFGGWDMSAVQGLTDLTSTSERGVKLTNLANGVELGLKGVNGGVFDVSYATSLVFAGPTSTTVYASSAHLHLDNVGAIFGAGTAPVGAVPPSVLVGNVRGPLYIHVDSNSILGKIGGGARGEMSIVIDGPGRLTGEFDLTTTSLDASAGAGVTLTRFGSTQAVNAVLSNSADWIAVDLAAASTGVSSFKLGGGADTFALYQNAAAPTVPRLANMHVTDGKVDGYAVVTDFAKNVDLVDLGPNITSVKTDLTQYIIQPLSLEQALVAVSTHLAVGQTGVFEYGGDTYIYRQNDVVGADTGDGLIKLLGVTGLSVVTGVGVVGDIHYG